jgi:hypothetical protein
LAFVISMLLFGCASPPEKAACTDDSQCRGERVCTDGVCRDPGTNNSANNGSNNASNNSATNSSNNGGFQPTKIVLVKDIDADSSQPVYYQDTADCGDRLGWLTLSEDESTIRLDRACGICACDELPDCQPIGCTGACPQPSVVELGPGESVEYEWPGYRWATDEVDGVSCDRKVAPVNATLTVEICYSRAPQETGPGELIEPECEDLVLDVGAETVELRLQ